jgi:hypothetical protein
MTKADTKTRIARTTAAILRARVEIKNFLTLAACWERMMIV